MANDSGQVALSMIPDASGYTSYSPEQQKDLSYFIKKCYLDKKNLNSTIKSYTVCKSKMEGKLSWWQTPFAVIGVSVFSFSLGLVFNNMTR